MKHWYLVILLVIAIIFVARPQPQADPLAELRTAADQLDAVCCTNTSLQLSLPPDVRMYATAEAICLRRESSLFCARCMCDVLPGEIMNTSAQQAVSCTLTHSGQAAVQCS